MSRAICNQKAASNTGLVGISETVIRSRAGKSYRVITATACPRKRQRAQKHFYHDGSPAGLAMARACALQWRTEQIAERAAHEATRERARRIYA